MEAAIESTVTRAETPNADELSGLDKIPNENVFSDRLIKHMKQILTVQQLRDAARDRRSVIVNHFIPSPSPAAWVININGGRLAQYFDAGMFIYEPKQPLEKHFRRTPPATYKPKETKLLENKL